MLPVNHFSFPTTHTPCLGCSWTEESILGINTQGQNYRIGVLTRGHNEFDGINARTWRDVDLAWRVISHVDYAMWEIGEMEREEKEGGRRYLKVRKSAF